MGISHMIASLVHRKIVWLLEKNNSISTKRDKYMIKYLTSKKCSLLLEHVFSPCYSCISSFHVVFLKYISIQIALFYHLRSLVTDSYISLYLTLHFPIQINCSLLVINIPQDSLLAKPHLKPSQDLANGVEEFTYIQLYITLNSTLWG